MAAAAGDKNTQSLYNQAGATKALREAQAGLKEFEAITEVAKRRQVIIDEGIAKERAAETERLEIHAKKLQAGEAWMAQVNQIAKVNREAAEFEKNLADEQTKLDESNKVLIESFTDMGDAHTQAGDAAEAAGAQTVAAYAGIAQ